MSFRKNRDNRKTADRSRKLLVTLLLILAVAAGGGLAANFFSSDAKSAAANVQTAAVQTEADAETAEKAVLTGGQQPDPEEIPAWDGSPYVELNANRPDFSSDELIRTSFEVYSDLDSLGRCGVCAANIGQDIMPTEERGEIGMVKPSGWHTVKYSFLTDRYLYNRCHLIGYQLSGENSNTRNLITGTRYLNVEGMLPFENEVGDYVRDTGNHVLYRVTPCFLGDNLVASGVQIEAESVEDGGSGICFNVYCYNVQPGVTIDYATGDSREDTAIVDTVESGSEADESAAEGDSTVGSDQENNAGADSGTTYVVNTNTGKFHLPSCSSVETIKPKNRKDFTGSRDELIQEGYTPCKRCNP